MDLTTESYNIELTTNVITETSFISDFITATSDEKLLAEHPKNTTLINGTQHDEFLFVQPVFEGFIIAEIFMTAIELAIAFIAAFKITGWRGNYRNQMLMQISVARFMKRVFFYIQYLNTKGGIKSSLQLTVTLISSQIYIDYVITILVCFFIKHMYDSLIIVIVKISRNQFYRVLTCSWLLPIPLSAMWTFIIVTKLLDHWLTYVLVCCIFRWPLMFISITLYIIVLYRVLKDDTRKFAWCLTIITFLLCFIVNFYLLFKDIIELWCLRSFTTILVSYVLGFCLNLLVLSLYIILVILNYHSNQKPCNSYAQHSMANVID